MITLIWPDDFSCAIENWGWPWLSLERPHEMGTRELINEVIGNKYVDIEETETKRMQAMGRWMVLWRILNVDVGG